jgi:hypothetical protein
VIKLLEGGMIINSEIKRHGHSDALIGNKRHSIYYWPHYISSKRADKLLKSVPEQVLLCLTQLQRETVERRRMGLTYKKIGESMGVTAETSRQHCICAFVRLRELLILGGY